MRIVKELQDVVKFLNTHGSSDQVKAIREAVRIIEDNDYMLDHIRFLASSIIDLTNPKVKDDG
jgi:hypothetical protein